MGRLLEYNNTVDECREEGYPIRIPLKMIQVTEKDGCVRPLSFDWENQDGSTAHVIIGRVISITPSAERKSGAVGDRYECEVEGRIEYLYYAKLQPRKWFLIQKVSEAEYNAYYRLPGEADGKPIV